MIEKLVNHRPEFDNPIWFRADTLLGETAAFALFEGLRDDGRVTLAYQTRSGKRGRGAVPLDKLKEDMVLKPHERLPWWVVKPT